MVAEIATTPVYRVCVRSSGRAKVLRSRWDYYQDLFYGEPKLYVSATEKEQYAPLFNCIEWAAEEGPGSQVTAMLKDTPPGTWLVVVDDNIKVVRFRNKPATAAQLRALFRHAMNTSGLHGFSADCNRNTYGKHIREGLTVKQDLLFALFAVKVPRASSSEEWAALLATTHGHMVDDLERSCRVYCQGGEGET